LLGVTSARSSRVILTNHSSTTPLESGVLVDLRAKLATPLFDRGIDAVGYHLSRGIALVARLGETDFRPGAKRERPLFAKELVAKAPVFGAVRHY
jgi:hypothetical protein